MQLSTLRVRPVLTLVALVASLTASVHQAVTVRGTVKGKQGDLKTFVSLSLDGPRHYAAVTDSIGRFTILNVIPGNYTVKVRQGDKVNDFVNRAVGSDTLKLVVSW